MDLLPCDFMARMAMPAQIETALPAWARQATDFVAALGFEVFIHDDLQGAKKLGVLRGQVEFGIGRAVGVEFLAMNHVSLRRAC